MIAMLCWSQIFLMFLLHGRQENHAMTANQANAVFNPRRATVLNLARQDPCYCFRAVLSIPAMRAAAVEACRFALENFRGLPGHERRNCGNADEADCRPIGRRREPRCTFICDVQVPWRREGNRLERVDEVSREERTLKSIAKPVLEPINPPNYHPDIPQRQRIMARPPTPSP